MATLYRTYTSQVPIEVILGANNFAGMHPTMQQRVRGLLEASGGRAGWGYGVRTSQEQLRLFLSRHRPDPDGKVEYNGQRYTLVGSPAARPGNSMHEIGLAADLRGEPTNNKNIDDCSWLVANASKIAVSARGEEIDEVPEPTFDDVDLDDLDLDDLDLVELLAEVPAT